MNLYCQNCMHFKQKVIAYQMYNYGLSVLSCLKTMNLYDYKSLINYFKGEK